jgi:hypothetical protein
MTISEFIKELQQYPQDYEVILSKDSEGNSYSPLVEIVDGVYEEESTYSGDFLPFDIEYQEQGISKEEWEDYKSKNKKVIVLYPIN